MQRGKVSLTSSIDKIKSTHFSYVSHWSNEGVGRVARTHSREGLDNFWPLTLVWWLPNTLRSIEQSRVELNLPSPLSMSNTECPSYELSRLRSIIHSVNRNNCHFRLYTNGHFRCSTWKEFIVSDFFKRRMVLSVLARRLSLHLSSVGAFSFWRAQVKMERLSLPLACLVRSKVINNSNSKAVERWTLNFVGSFVSRPSWPPVFRNSFRLNQRLVT